MTGEGIGRCGISAPTTPEVVMTPCTTYWFLLSDPTCIVSLSRALSSYNAGHDTARGENLRLLFDPSHIISLESEMLELSDTVEFRQF